MLKDIIIVKNYDRYIEARKNIEPGFAERNNGNEQDILSCLTEMYREMSLKKLGTKCKELITAEIEAMNNIGRLSSDDMNACITELVNHYSVLGLDHRLNSFMLNVLIEANKNRVSLAVVSKYKSELTGYFNTAPKSIVTAIDEFVKNMELKAFIEKMNYEKGQIKKIEKAKKSFATIGADEQILLYCSESLLGFSKGFIITDKKMYFSTDNVFSVSYDNVVDFCIKLKYGDEISTFRISDLEGYARMNADTFSKDSWCMKILYIDEKTGALCEEHFKSFRINDLETAKYLVALTDVIKKYSFALKYINSLK